MRKQVAFAVALLLDLIGAGAVLLVSTRAWQTIVMHRPRPLADATLAVSGRTVDSAPTAIGVLALAGVVAVLATRGIGRRVVGAVLVLAGAVGLWRSVAAAAAMSARRADALIAQKHPGVAIASGTQVSVHPQWAVLSAIGGALIVAGGVLIAARGHRWAGLSARYEAPSSASASASDAARADAQLWSAIERGEDPTLLDRPTD